MRKPKETDTTLKIRRAPKFLPFLITGAVLGLITGVILNFSFSGEFADGTTTAQNGILGYLVAWGSVIGAAVGVTLAVILDFVFTRSSKEVQATKLEA